MIIHCTMYSIGQFGQAVKVLGGVHCDFVCAVERERFLTHFAFGCTVPPGWLAGAFHITWKPQPGSRLPVRETTDVCLL